MHADITDTYNFVVRVPVYAVWVFIEDDSTKLVVNEILGLSDLPKKVPVVSVVFTTRPCLDIEAHYVRENNDKTENRENHTCRLHINRMRTIGLYMIPYTPSI